MIVKKIVIVVRGDTENDAEEALDTALARIVDGNVTGADRNDESGYYFNSTTDVPPNEVPA